MGCGSWRAADLGTADAEALTLPRCQFDVVLSCLGVMFAPHHQTAADELIRVCRPGGTIGLVAWTPGGLIGQMFATMKPYARRHLQERSLRHCGELKIMYASCSLIASTEYPHRLASCASATSLARKRSLTTSRPTTGRRSRPTSSLPMSPTGWPHLIRI